MSDRIAVMHRGVIEQVADPETVYERPATTFVAGFIGVSNLMPGVVTGAGGRGAVRLDSGVEVPVDVNGLVAGDRAHAVVRPEKLRIAAGGAVAGGGEPSVEGTVESSLFLGTATQIVVRLADDVPITVLVPNADEAERQRLPGGGARVHVSWAPEHTHVVRGSTAAGGPQSKSNGGETK